MPPIFETPCYSIENFYVSLDAFKEILKNEFQLSDLNDDVYKSCVDIFTARQKEFHEAVTLFNAWYACLIKIRNENGLKTGVNLEDKLPENFINFSLEKISSNYNLQIIKNNFPNATEVSEEILNRKVIDFKSCDHCKVFRGKYEMQFLLKIIELIIKDSQSDKKCIKQKISFSFGSALSNTQAISVFSAYAETPKILNDYLEEVIKCIVDPEIWTVV